MIEGATVPFFRLRVLAEQSTNLSADNISWGWNIEAADAPTNGELGALIEGFELAVGDAIGSGDSFGQFLQDNLEFTAIECYPGAGGEAVAVAGWTVPFSPGQSGAAPYPSEVALVLSHRISTVRGVRPRGRTYLGPFTSAVGSGGRPSQPLIDTALNFASLWHDALVAEGCTPIVLSASGTVNRGPIVGYGIDNAWDTQRRRGWEASALTTVTV